MFVLVTLLHPLLLQWFNGNTPPAVYLDATTPTIHISIYLHCLLPVFSKFSYNLCYIWMETDLVVKQHFSNSVIQAAIGGLILSDCRLACVSRSFPDTVTCGRRLQTNPSQ